MKINYPKQRRNSSMSKMLQRSTVFLLFLVFGLEYATSHTLGNKNVCFTPSCKDAAELLSKNIDQNEDPCKDFYKFACNGYVKSLTIPDGEHRAGHSATLKQKIAFQLKGLLEEKVDSKEPRLFRLAKNYYKSCMDESTRPNNLEVLKSTIKQLGGWPVVEGSGWIEEDFEIFNADRKLREMGFKPNRIFKIYPDMDLSNTSRSTLFIGPPDTIADLSSLKNLMLSVDANQAYYHFMVDLAVLFGAKKEKAEKDLLDVFLFEQSIHSDVLNETEATIPDISIQTIEDLYQIGDGKYPWLEYINNMTEPIARFENRSRINSGEPNFLRRISRSLNKTEKRTVANFMIWRVISDSVTYLPEKYQDKFYKFIKINSDRQAYPRKLPLWAECVNLVTDKENGLAVAVSSMYVRRYFRDETRKQVEPLMQSIGDAFRETVNKTSWMTDSMKAAAVQKLELMRSFIAYPDELLNDQKLDEYSLSLEILPNDHFQNFLNLQRFHYESGLSNLDQATNDHIWTFFSDSFIVNAYYHTLINYFVVLASILQPPVFNPEWPSYATFGGIGFIIGHEIMHAYNPLSVSNKIPGVMTGWLDDTKKDVFSNRTDCLVHQYNAYTDEQTEERINGKSNLDENAADNAGLKIAYRAYHNWVKNYGEDPRPAQLQNYTSDQLFFVSSMNFFCEKLTDEQRSDDITLDSHAPADIRALGMFSNSEEFARAFNCPVGSTMNPGKRCAIWE